MNSQNIPSVREFGKLAVIEDLLDAFHKQDIRYCHWKSNEHLDASMRGLTDLDVLVERGRTADLQRALAETGFLRFQATAGTAYPGVEDYLALDPATGRLVHLHLHHLLTLGEPHLKGYRLPWEEAALKGRVKDPNAGVFTASPEMELLLLVVRDALKRRFRTRVKHWLGLAKTGGDFKAEYDWLVARGNRAECLSLAERLIGAGASDALEALLAADASPEARARFASFARPLMSRHRSYSTPAAALARKVREAIWIVGGISKRKLHFGVPLRRVSPRGGLVVAILGSDGAGKSTVLADTTKWLGQKLDVHPIYMGSGDGPASLLRLPLKFARVLIEGRSDAPRVEHRPKGKAKVHSSKLRRLGRLPWALALAHEKAGKLKRMVRARNRGLVVLCDRFPQNQVEGFNDGPLLSDYLEANNRWLRALSRWERRVYDRAALTPPDIVIKLIASTETAMERRPELACEEIERRIDATRSLCFPEGTRIVEIDTDQPLDLVLLTVRRLIWAQL